MANTTYINNVDNGVISRDDFIYHGCSADGGVSSGQLGFGLAQWTYYSRKEGFYDYMYANGSSIGNLGNQIQYVIEEIRSYFKDRVYDTIIPRLIRLAEAPSHGMPAVYYDNKCKGAIAYLELAEEFIDLEEDII